jgi:2-keto-4-pentenoate hydratase/2-oxohepta-3-ene-1,7-dioic acid hydratase in catechol pathway
MKLVSAVVDGREMFGAVVDDAVRDLSAVPGWSSMIDALSAPPMRVEAAVADAPSIPLATIELLPPVPHPRRILCAGLNYADHVAESLTPRPRGDHPVIFTRFPSSLVGHGQAIVRPGASEQLDYEGELAIVIGATTRSVPSSSAMAAVAGYACFMDGSVRDFQRHTSQFTPGKNFDASGSWGPWIVTADEIDDPATLTLTTRVDGEVVQQASTVDMIFTIPELIAYCSTFTTLEPGDVIATGTPGGVGAARTPPRWLCDGDTVDVEVTEVGVLTNHVVDEQV